MVLYVSEALLPSFALNLITALCSIVKNQHGQISRLLRTFVSFELLNEMRTTFARAPADIGGLLRMHNYIDAATAACDIAACDIRGVLKLI